VSPALFQAAPPAVLPFGSPAPFGAFPGAGCSGGFAAPPALQSAPPAFYLSNVNGGGAAQMQASPPGYPGGSQFGNGHANGLGLISQQLQRIEQRLSWLEAQR